MMSVLKVLLLLMLPERCGTGTGVDAPDVCADDARDE
jgi:hypothetical protein